MKNKEPVSIIMPMMNSSTTVLHALESIKRQKYPVKEIIIYDNASVDNSVNSVLEYSRKMKMPLRVIRRKKNMGVGVNFNAGVKESTSKIIVLMHSDCSLPTEKELEKLVRPMNEDSSVVATFPTIYLLEEVWEKYDFWEKYFFARQAGTNIAGFTTKFDAVRRDAYLKLDGFDMENFGVGWEDADFHDRLRDIGKVVKSEAKVTHLHYLGQGQFLRKLFQKKRVYARIYGRLARVKSKSFLSNNAILLIKPTLAIMPFLPGLQIAGLLLLFSYAFLFTKKMFVTKSTLSDFRIIILPFLNIFFIYYETFWMIEAFLFGKNKIE